MTTRRILGQDLLLISCKFQITEQLERLDYLKDLACVNWFREEVADFLQNNLFPSSMIG